MRSLSPHSTGLQLSEFCHTLSYMNTFAAPLTQPNDDNKGRQNARINARIAPHTARQIASLKAALGVSVSDILRDSIAMYDAAMTKKKPAPLSALGKHIGKHDSGSDGTLSVTYKAEIAKYLEKKYPRQ